MRVLLSEGSSLTAREHLSVLGPQGAVVDVMAARRDCLARFSRWSRRLVVAPASGRDPHGYLAAVERAVRATAYDALLPTHEQAWLLAAAAPRLCELVPLAVASYDAFAYVQGKVACCRLLDELRVPQPAWVVVPTEAAAGAVDLPCFLKASFSTAGRGVRLVATAEQARTAFTELAQRGPVLAQQVATGRYAQIAGLFAHGRLVAVHGSEQLAVGAGGSCAARVGVVHPRARHHLERLGAHLRWHGGLTLDYLHTGGEPVVIEANPRTVEPGNAAASGVDLPALTVAISRGDSLPAQVVTGRPGVRTHGLLALALGAAENSGSRRAILQSLGYGRRVPESVEVLTPRADPVSRIALHTVVAQVLAAPGRVGAITARAVTDYAVTLKAVEAVRA